MPELDFEERVHFRFYEVEARREGVRMSITQVEDTTKYQQSGIKDKLLWEEESIVLFSLLNSVPDGCNFFLFVNIR